MDNKYIHTQKGKKVVFDVKKFDLNVVCMTTYWLLVEGVESSKALSQSNLSNKPNLTKELKITVIPVSFGPCHYYHCFHSVSRKTVCTQVPLSDSGPG